MNRNVLVVLLLGAFGAATAAWSPSVRATAQPEPKSAKADLDDEERVIAFADAPAAVRAAALKMTEEKSIKRVIREADDGALAFEIEYTGAKGLTTAKLSEAGLLMETEAPMAADALPAAVRDAILREHADAKIGDAVEATEIVYEVMVTVGGKSHEMKFDANGVALDDDEDGDDEHDDEKDDDGDR